MSGFNQGNYTYQPPQQDAYPFNSQFNNGPPNQNWRPNFTNQNNTAGNLQNNMPHAANVGSHVSNIVPPAVQINNPSFYNCGQGNQVYRPAYGAYFNNNGNHQNLNSQQPLAAPTEFFGSRPLYKTSTGNNTPFIHGNNQNKPTRYFVSQSNVNHVSDIIHGPGNLTGQHQIHQYQPKPCYPNGPQNFNVQNQQGFHPNVGNRFPTPVPVHSANQVPSQTFNASDACSLQQAKGSGPLIPDKNVSVANQNVTGCHVMPQPESFQSVANISQPGSFQSVANISQPVVPPTNTSVKPDVISNLSQLKLSDNNNLIQVKIERPEGKIENERRNTNVLINLSESDVNFVSKETVTKQEKSKPKSHISTASGGIISKSEINLKVKKTKTPLLILDPHSEKGFRKVITEGNNSQNAQLKSDNNKSIKGKNNSVLNNMGTSETNVSNIAGHESLVGSTCHVVSTGASLPTQTYQLVKSIDALVSQLDKKCRSMKNSNQLLDDGETCTADKSSKTLKNSDNELRFKEQTQSNEGELMTAEGIKTLSHSDVIKDQICSKVKVMNRKETLEHDPSMQMNKTINVEKPKTFKRCEIFEVSCDGSRKMVLEATDSMRDKMEGSVVVDKNDMSSYDDNSSFQKIPASQKLPDKDSCQDNSGLLESEDIPVLECEDQNIDKTDDNFDMYSQYQQCGNPTQRGRGGRPYHRGYNQNIQRDSQYRRKNFDNQYVNNNEQQFYENYNDPYVRPPIHRQRSQEDDPRFRQHDHYRGGRGFYSNNRNYNMDNSNSKIQRGMQKSYSSEDFPSHHAMKKTNSYDDSEHYRNSRRREGSGNERKQPLLRSPNNHSFRNTQNINRHSDSTEMTHKDCTENVNLGKVSSNLEVSSAFSPGSKIYQSEQYFSADGTPDSVTNRPVIRSKNLKPDDKPESKNTPSKVYVSKPEIKHTPIKNLKPGSVIDKSETRKDLKPGAKDSVDSYGESKDSKSVEIGIATNQKESSPKCMDATGEEKNKLKDKMDFSSIKKALSEVKSPDPDPSSSKSASNNLKENLFDKFAKAAKSDDIGKSPIRRKNSGDKTNDNSHGLDKLHRSPRSRNSSGDSQSMMSPTALSDIRQRSAFHSVLSREDSESSKTSPYDNGLSPKDRKRRVSGDVKTSRKNSFGSPDSDKARLHHNSHSDQSKSKPDSDISLKSALTYPEWKRLKAQQEELTKEKEKTRPCIEIANTPEEYRRLLNLERQKKKKEKSRKSSEGEKDVNKLSISDGEAESGQLPSLLNSHNSFQAINSTEEHGVSDDDIDLEDSDDDDLEAPAFLFSLEEASTRPIPGTPTKLTGNIESPGPSSPLPEPDLTDITKKSLLSSKFSLDQLVSEKVDKSEEQREYEEINAKLQEGLKKGGFVKDTLETVETHEEDILPEHEKQLQDFQVLDSVISDVHPGDVIFQPILYQRLFTGSLSVQTCGFTPGASYIDKYLSVLQPSNYSLLLTSNILKNTLENVSCLESVLKWLFLLMSIHSNQLVTQGCSKVLLEHLNRQVHFKQSPQTWAPAISDVLAVFCNYGCEVKRLLPDSVLSPTEDYSNSIIHEEMNGNFPAGGSYSLRNLHLVLNMIGQALHARPRYSNRQLTELLVILCHVAMDKSHHSEVLPHEFQVCFRGVLRCYSSNYWDSNCNDLCHTLFKITTHHHNRLYLAQLFPEDKRGAYIQKRLSYLYLQDMFETGNNIDINDFKVKCLHVFLPKLQNLVQSDVYQLSSAISYLDLAVGNSTVKVADKEDLQYLSDQLKKISGDVKDSVRMLDRSWVKDMMVRVCSKWTLYLLSVGSKQKSIFAYAKKTASLPLVEKTVEAVQEDISSQSEEETDNQFTSTSIDCINEDSILKDTINEINSQTDVSAVKKDKPDVIPINDCDSPMEVDLTGDDDLPDLLAD